MAEDMPKLDISRLSMLIEEVNKLLDSAEKIEPSAKKLNAEIVRNYSDDQLIIWVNNSKQEQWEDRPMFFRAIAEEVRKRPSISPETRTN
jgi:hypothetical protein